MQFMYTTTGSGMKSVSLVDQDKAAIDSYSRIYFVCPYQI